MKILSNSINYSPDLLKEIETCAQTLMAPSMVAIRLDIDEVRLIDDIHTPGHPARRAYYQGLEYTDGELRQ